MGYISMFNSSGSYTSNGGRTGASFDNGTCASTSGCHVSGSFSPTTTIQLFDGSNAVTSYTANHSYTLRITITSSGTNSSTRYGFQSVCVQSSTNNNINGWGSMPSGTKTVTINSRTYASHSTRLTSNVINIPWTSPATSTGNITFYASGLVANGNFQQSGDNVDTAFLTISPSTSSGCKTPTITPSVTNVKCNGESTGSINIATSGGTTPFSYSWTGPGGYTSTQKDIAGIKAGQYQLILTANGGCKDTVDVTVNEPPTISVNAGPDTALCIGENISLYTNSTGGVGTLSYSWTGPNSFNSTSSSTSISNAGYVNTGDYVIIVKDANNCTMNDTVTVQVDSIPKIDSMLVMLLSNNTYAFSLVNPRFINSVSWSFGDGKNGNAQTLSHTYVNYGVFNVRLIISNQCGNDTFEKYIPVWPTTLNQTNKPAPSIEVYPNPAMQDVNISIDRTSIINKVTITTMEGKIVYINDTYNSSSVRLNTSTYPAGLYIIQVETNSGKYKQRLNVIH